jgi:transposase
MADWLLACKIRTVVMQSTGVYWMAVHDVLERRGIDVHLVDARATRNVPGRKSDVQECQWLLKLHTYGLLRKCFLPSEQVQRVRTVWRIREQYVRESGRCVQQMQKALISMNVQLHLALSDLSGVSGQAILRAMVRGERDPRRLAALRHGTCQAKEEEIVQSLQGNWREDGIFALEQAIENWDFYRQQMTKCDQKLEQYLGQLPNSQHTSAPSETASKKKNRKPRSNQPGFNLRAEQIRLLGVDATAIDGLDVMTVQTVLAEVGPDLSAWKSEAQWSAWLNLAPKRDISGGRVIRHVREHRTNRVGQAFRMAAQSLVRSQSYLGAKYRYLRAKLGGLKAAKAMGRVLAGLYYRLVTRGHVWLDQGAEDFEHRRRQRDLSALQRKAASLGLQLVPAA